MIYLISYLFVVYLISYIIYRAFDGHNNRLDDGEKAMLFFGSLLWPLTVIVVTVMAIGYGIVNNTKKIYRPMDYIVHLFTTLYKSILSKIETRYYKYKTKGYKPYVQASNKRANV